MKVYAMMMTYEQMDWLPWAIKQAKSMLDMGSIEKFLIAEGSHSKNFPEHSPDGSLEFLKKELDDRFQLFDASKFRNSFPTYQTAQPALLNEMLSTIPKEDDTWLMYTHDDEFYYDEFLKELKDVCQEAQDKGFNTIMTSQVAFAYNFNLYWRKRTGYLLNKINMDTKWVPISSVAHGNGMRYLDDINKVWMDQTPHRTTFHFSYVKKTHRMEQRMSNASEAGSQNMQDFWYKEIFLNADLNNLEKTYKKGVEFWGSEGFYKDSYDLGGPVVQPLINYEYSYPQVLEDHPYRDIKDCRELA